MSVYGQNGRKEFEIKLNESLSLVKQNPKSAITFCQEAFEIAVANDDTWAQGMAMSGMGYISYKGRDYEAAYVNYMEALSLMENADSTDLYNIMDILNHISMVHSKFNSYDESIDYLKRAIEVSNRYVSAHSWHAEKYNQKRVLVDYPYYLAVEYEKKGAHHTAGKILMSLWEQAENENDIVTHARVLNRLGIIKKDNGEYNEALEYFALVAGESQVSDKYKAIAFHNLGETYMVQGELERAETNYLLALDLKKEINNSRSTFITYQGLGELEYKKGNMQAAIDFWESGLSIFDKVESEPDLYGVYNWLQLAYMDIDIERAKTFNQTYAQLNNFYVRNQTFQREEESQRREALSMLIDKEKQRRVDADQRQRFIEQFWPVFLGVGLLVLFSIILGIRYYMALRANRILSGSQLKLERAKEILRSAEADLD